MIAYINSLKAVEYALYNGYDKTLGKQFGLLAGEAEALLTFEDFYHAVIRQWEHLIEMTISVSSAYETYLGYINPSNMYSATIENALSKGCDAYQSGVKFNNSSVLNCGFADLIDSIMAIKEFVYEKKTVSLEELKSALDKNWIGYEELLTAIRKSRHKYGNNDPETDAYAEALSSYYTTKINNRPNARGGVYKASIHSAMEFVWEGEKTIAAPNGRYSGEELSKNASPCVGMDKNGVTALLNSVFAAKPSSYCESFCIDVMLHPSAVSGDEGLPIMKSLLFSYMKHGGMSIQFNIFVVNMLRDAQKHPERYRNLQVRVCGWNVLWNNLSPKEQNAYIARAEAIRYFMPSFCIDKPPDFCYTIITTNPFREVSQVKNASAPFNPGERLTVPFASYPLRSCGGMDSLDLQKPGNAVRMLKEMGVGQTFLAVEAPWGDPVAVVKEKAILCRHIEAFHRAGIRAGVWFWPGIYPTGERKLTRQVLADGSVLAKCCPLDEDYLSALETYTASLAETGADALMIDDGFRYGFENRNFGCFCPLHLRAVSELVGHEVSAADLRRATLSGGENPIRSAFLKVNAESLVGFARRMRAAVDRVNPSVRIAVCSAPSSWETDGTDPETVSRAFAGNTKPFLRTSGAPYWADHRSFGCRMEDIIEFERFQTAAFAKPDMEVMWEGDTYPRPRWNCAASYMECFDLARAIADPAVHNLKYLFEYSTEPENEQGYFKRHMRNLPLYRAIAEHFDDKRPCGIRVFEVPHKYDRMDIPERFENKNYDLQLTCFNPSSKILSPVGLPTVFAGDGTGIAVFGENAKYLPDTDFGKGLLLDARAAEILSARGLDVGLRGEGKSFAADMEHYLADGFHIRAFDQPIRNFTTDASAIPEMTALSPDGVTVATSYRYENAAGQRFFVLCSDAYGSVERYHRVYGRSRLLARAAEWVSGRKLPAWTSGSPDLYLMCKENDGALAVGLFNLFEDEALDTEIHLGDSYRSVTFFSGSGRLDGDRVLLDDIPPFGVVTFEVTR